MYYNRKFAICYHSALKNGKTVVFSFFILSYFRFVTVIPGLKEEEGGREVLFFTFESNSVISQIALYCSFLSTVHHCKKIDAGFHFTKEYNGI